MIDLSICIPTFERFDSLSKTLSSLKQCLHEKLSINIELLVIDNCSADTKYQDIKELEFSSNVNFRYFRNDRNVGLSGNILNCFYKASGNYIWILSDDDQLNVENFKFLPKLLASEPDLIYLRSDVQGIERISNINRIESVADFLKYFPAYSGIGFISTSIYSKRILTYFETGINNAGTLFPHVAMLFSYLKACAENKNGKFLVEITDSKYGNIVTWTPNNRSYSALYFNAIAGMIVLGELLDKDHRLVFGDKLSRDFGGTHLFKMLFISRKVFFTTIQHLGILILLKVVLWYGPKRWIGVMKMRMKRVLNW